MIRDSMPDRRNAEDVGRTPKTLVNVCNPDGLRACTIHVQTEVEM